MADRAGNRGGVLPALVVVQVLLAVVSLAIIAYVATRIGPMLEEKAELEAGIEQARETIQTYQYRMASLEREISETREQLEEARQRLEETADMGRFTFPMDPIDVKSLASRHPGPAEALRLILEMRSRGVGWHLGGQTPEEGFDSPSFAAFILLELGKLQEPLAPGDSLLATSRNLFRRLPASERADVGDLVFYPTGYVLFRFVDERDVPYVIGMTPMGIVALRPDFADPIGIRDAGLGS